MQNVLLSIGGGWLLGLIFSAFRIPLPVPPLMGLIAAAACLAGQASWIFLQHYVLHRT